MQKILITLIFLLLGTYTFANGEQEDNVDQFERTPIQESSKQISISGILTKDNDNYIVTSENGQEYQIALPHNPGEQQGPGGPPPNGNDQGMPPQGGQGGKPDGPSGPPPMQENGNLSSAQLDKLLTKEVTITGIAMDPPPEQTRKMLFPQSITSEGKEIL